MNEFKKECGAGYYWCSTDKVCKPIDMHEDIAVPTNNIGSGNIAGAGVGKDGEPGVKKRKLYPFITYMRRKDVDS